MTKKKTNNNNNNNNKDCKRDYGGTPLIRPPTGHEIYLNSKNGVFRNLVHIIAKVQNKTYFKNWSSMINV